MLINEMFKTLCFSRCLSGFFIEPTFESEMLYVEKIKGFLNE